MPDGRADAAGVEPRTVAPRTERPGRRHVSRSTLVLRWLGLALLVGVALAYVQPLRSLQATKAEVASQQAELERLTERRDLLRQRLAASESDVFVEREARKLGLVKRGEQLFVVQGIEAWKAARAR